MSVWLCQCLRILRERINCTYLKQLKWTYSEVLQKLNALFAFVWQLHLKVVFVLFQMTKVSSFTQILDDTGFVLFDLTTGA